ncbi:Cupredoxin [Amylostereum chailletii]|nr:Cupredoxin [Amylostereum chailletii]
MLFSLSLVAAAISLAAIPPVRAAEHTIQVGGIGGVVAYNPNNVTADVGDVVTFVFRQKNHTVTQSSLASPCSPLANGFDSGFIPVPDNNTDGPFQIAQFTVQDTNPVWVYCRQAGHCQQGMVFAINPGEKMDQFISNAIGNTSTSTDNSTTTSASASAAAATTTAAASSAAATSASATSSSAPATSTSSDHKIVVGGPNQLLFQPSNISAQAGDTITFEFHQKNHTATQSSFPAPCRPLTDTSTSGQVGFNSGFMPVADNATTFPTYTIQVNDTAPIWVYCAQANHCGSGMVFSVNALENGTSDFAAFQARAMSQNGTSSSSNSASGTSNSAPAPLTGRSAALLAATVVLGFIVL